ncbi:uncharacterized protein LOC115626431 [Scaptodrosophila lebanonensis]|uniref:Uncharacterized protein LOC115626431 n=1 Tax=Drosophila lebanonensis TaxID=7225 RepID=A0A6J2TQ75_DROLE|nr:uncharacterized protein LOC115626431 [Scaptodrosophila lebanonensis]
MDEGDESTTHYYLECDNNVEEWHWNAKSTKLLVELYLERRDRFRDPKHRKRVLWTEIVDEMERAGYKGINEDLCDRKMRNMKKTYRTCKESMRRTGRKRVSWEHYETFDELFQHEPQSTSKPEATALAEEPTIKCKTCPTQLDPNGDMFVPNALNGQLLVIERSRVAAIKELSKRIEESNAIQRERNDLLREYLAQL